MIAIPIELKDAQNFITKRKEYGGIERWKRTQ